MHGSNLFKSQRDTLWPAQIQLLITSLKHRVARKPAALSILQGVLLHTFNPSKRSTTTTVYFFRRALNVLSGSRFLAPTLNPLPLLCQSDVLFVVIILAIATTLPREIRSRYEWPLRTYWYSCANTVHNLLNSPRRVFEIPRIQQSGTTQHAVIASGCGTPSVPRRPTALSDVAG